MMISASQTKQIALGKETRIGRATTNDLVIDVDQVSRVHALISVGEAFVTIKDMGSRNGTYVNDERIETQVLANGDSIRVGACELRFLAGDQEYTQVEALRLMTVPGLLLDLDKLRPPASVRGSVTR
ncbi:FHA domain-containing protein [Variovorax sp. KK3]|uniref:FHA domain-containing protein n=1 Tax=Variovorax sp. KK3 TaxID=1855728 RepID=UPI00097BC79D|nr:FHA domain-containing protein [Variovorax sp. KK3]